MKSRQGMIRHAEIAGSFAVMDGITAMKFTMQIEFEVPEPDFSPVPASFEELAPTAIEELVAGRRRLWRADQQTDVADVLMLLHRRIMRGELIGPIRNVAGVHIGQYCLSF